MDLLLKPLQVLAFFVLVPAFIYICVKCACIGYFSAKRVYDKMRIQDSQTKPKDRSST